MARYITVSLLGPGAQQTQGEKDYDKLVDRMIAHWDECLDPVLCDKPDLIVVPEACDRYADHTMPEREAYYRVRGDRVKEHFQKVAQENNCYFAYSAAREMPDHTWRNSTQIIGRDGRVEGIYNKNHLVVTEGVNYTPMLCGRDAPVFDLDFGRAACAICFDLNFEQLKNRYRAQKPEIILFSSMYHGGFVQRSWAYDCRSYFAGAICGQECAVINPLGEIVAASTNYFPHVTTRINLDYAVLHLDGNWKKIAAAKKKYGQKVGFFDPGRLGAVLLTSETDEFTVKDLIREFEIETLDEYFERSVAAQQKRVEGENV